MQHEQGRSSMPRQESRGTSWRPHRRAYQKYRERQRLQREEDRRTIEELEGRLQALELQRTDLVQRVDVLQKVTRPEGVPFRSALSASSSVPSFRRLAHQPAYQLDR